MWAAYTPPRAREASAGEKTLKFSKNIGKINENHWFFSKMVIFPPRRRISQIFGQEVRPRCQVCVFGGDSVLIGIWNDP